MRFHDEAYKLARIAAEYWNPPVPSPSGKQAVDWALELVRMAEVALKNDAAAQEAAREVISLRQRKSEEK